MSVLQTDLADVDKSNETFNLVLNAKLPFQAGFGRRLQSTLVLIEHDGQKVRTC